MKKLLNTLYVFTEDAYLSLDSENIVIKNGGKELGRIPFCTLENIISFSRFGASPQLMGACADHGVSLSFFTTSGRFLAGIHGRQHGNVLLRREQYHWADDSEKSISVAAPMISAKIFNSRWILERSIRDHKMRINVDMVTECSNRLAALSTAAYSASSEETLRGIEGEAATTYFSCFDELILRDKEAFIFETRTRRPPKNRVNSMLSLFYSVLANDCSSALESVGLDPYVGFLHSDRPGRASLALDLMEELRAPVVDRFVVSSINNRVVSPDDFLIRETGEVKLTNDGKKNLFQAWQKKKAEKIKHPFLDESISWGLVPFAQAQLLARYVRGDLDGYPAFLWK